MRRRCRRPAVPVLVLLDASPGDPPTDTSDPQGHLRSLRGRGGTLIVLAVPMAVIATVIWLSGRGPALFI
jgi:hypothetical protein